MGDVIDFETGKRKLEVRDHQGYDLGTISFDDIFVDVLDPQDFIDHINIINRDLTDGMFMEHIANLMEVCSYNVDWTTAPEWHRDMFERAASFYNDFYEKDK